MHMHMCLYSETCVCACIRMCVCVCGVCMCLHECVIHNIEHMEINAIIVLYRLFSLRCVKNNG